MLGRTWSQGLLVENFINQILLAEPFKVAHLHAFGNFFEVGQQPVLQLVNGVHKGNKGETVGLRRGEGPGLATCNGPLGLKKPATARKRLGRPITFAGYAGYEIAPRGAQRINKKIRSRKGRGKFSKRWAGNER